MAVIDAKLVPVLIEKLQTELDEIKVISNWLTVVVMLASCIHANN